MDEIKAVKAENQGAVEVITVYNKIPYSLLSQEIEQDSKDTLEELSQIIKYYNIYKNGAKFNVEGTNGDYVPAELKYKLAASLVDKEARFLFAESPDISISPKIEADKATQEMKDNVSRYNELVQSILDENMFESILIKAAKDCFIGKRIAWLVNFNEEDGVTVSFIPSTNFIYETKTGNPHIITKFVCFMIVKNSKNLKEKVIFRKRYYKDGEDVYLQEDLFDGTGALIENVFPEQKILLDYIPAGVIINDGLTGDENGESEISILQDYESWYSKMANADLDAERKTMNPVVYTIDMDSKSTKNLSRASGSYWDLLSDQNLDKSAPSVGVIESSMSYSTSLDTSLNRIKNSIFEQVDVPNINLETMVGSITSGKALKAIYWPLIVRCKEKMKVWAPQLRKLVDTIIRGSMVYPNCIEKYTDEPLVPTDYKIEVVQNIPLSEDETEEKETDLSEVMAQAMSRKSYIKKWRNISDTEADAELEQIAKEKQLLESSFSMDDMGGFGEVEENTEGEEV